MSYLALKLLLHLCFSVSSEPNNVACPTTASIQKPSSSSAQLPTRKRTRKRQKRKGKKKAEKEDKQTRRHRIPSGVPEQESGSSPIPLTAQVNIQFSFTHIYMYVCIYEKAIESEARPQRSTCQK